MGKPGSHIGISALNSGTASSASEHDILILLPNVYLGYRHSTHNGASVWSL
jgi:hypothetical protein